MAEPLTHSAQPPRPNPITYLFTTTLSGGFLHVAGASDKMRILSTVPPQTINSL